MLGFGSGLGLGLGLGVVLGYGLAFRAFFCFAKSLVVMLERHAVPPFFFFHAVSYVFIYVASVRRPNPPLCPSALSLCPFAPCVPVSSAVSLPRRPCVPVCPTCVFVRLSSCVPVPLYPCVPISLYPCVPVCLCAQVRRF